MSVLNEFRLVSSGSELMKPPMMFDTMPTPSPSIRNAKNRTQKPALDSPAKCS